MFGQPKFCIYSFVDGQIQIHNEWGGCKSILSNNNHCHLLHERLLVIKMHIIYNQSN